MENHDIDKSPIPKLALIGMWMMGIGLITVLFNPILGIFLLAVGMVIGIAPPRP